MRQETESTDYDTKKEVTPFLDIVFIQFSAQQI